MRKSTFLVLCIIAVTAVVFSAGCNKTPSVKYPDTVRRIIGTNPQFSILDSGITIAYISNAIDSSGVTFFAPDNDAFAASGLTETMIAAMPVQTLKNMFKYGIVFPAIDTSAFPVSDSIRSFEGALLFISHNANGIFVNGIKIKTGDMVATNGFIDVVSQVLMPPTFSIQNTIAADTSLSLFADALIKIGLWSSLNLPAKYTVFAPVNNAFRAAGFLTTTQINSAADTTIQRIVNNHIIGTNVFTSDFTNGGQITNLEGNILIEGISGTIQLTGSGNPPSNILTPNILTTNGVVHKIYSILE